MLGAWEAGIRTAKATRVSRITPNTTNVHFVLGKLLVVCLVPVSILALVALAVPAIIDIAISSLAPHPLKTGSPFSQHTGARAGPY